MKQIIKHNRMWSILFAIVAIGVLAASIAVPEVATFVLAALGLGGAGVAGSTLAVGTTVTGPVTVETTAAANSEHLARSVDDMVTMRKPDDAPLDTLVRKIAKKKKVGNFKAEWEEVATRGTEDTLTATNTAAGSSADDEVDLAVTYPEIWNVGDTGICPTVNGGDSNAFVFFVTAVDTSGDTITVQGVNGTNGGTGTRVPTITSGTKIYRLGPASHERQARMGEIYQVPTGDYNYCQTFQAELSEGELESLHKAYSGFNYQDKKELALYEFRTAMNASHFFGSRNVKTYSDGKKRYTAGGIWNKISNTFTYGSGGGATDISVSDVIDIQQGVYSVNNGSYTRYMLAGGDLSAAINKVETDKRRLKAEETEVVIGLKAMKLVSNFGETVVIHDKTLDKYGYGKYGVILDFAHIQKAELSPMKATPLNLNETGQDRVINAFRLEETSCLQLRYAGSGGVHAIIYPDPNT